MTETPDSVHGRLLEAVHISGYTFERACSEFDWLLTDERWKKIGQGFDDVNAFLATIDLSEFKIAIEQRKTIAKKLAELQASQRATARALGVGLGTVQRDLDDDPNGSAVIQEVTPKADDTLANDPNGSPAAWFQDDVDPARLAKGRSARKERDREAERNRLETLAAEPVEVDGAEIHLGDFREVFPDLGGVDAIITDPPYAREHLPLLADLAVFADRVLAPDGILAVLFGQTHLPEVHRLLEGGRPYRWTACFLTPGAGYVSHAGRVQSGWKPVLVYGGGPRFADVVHSEGLQVAKEHHRWGQDVAAFATLVERLTQPGQLVADPFLGGGTTAVVCKSLGRRFIGCDVDENAVATTRERLAA